MLVFLFAKELVFPGDFITLEVYCIVNWCFVATGDSDLGEHLWRHHEM